ncbi:hypothetical protein TrCOL_g2983 [Triparma columacea]|uniref:HSF-type DNA-binding domain-containing protein n=1 Tax=Triparma columacea TaxID=722753 RepID=A0A9W7G0I4_9STRA|nr:hypothetical protein TrCOL_g2983 [Triparma columacea]
MPLDFSCFHLFAARSLEMLSESKRERVINEVVSRFVIPMKTSVDSVKENQSSVQRSSSVGRSSTVEGINADIWGDGTYEMEISTTGLRESASHDTEVRFMGDFFGGSITGASVNTWELVPIGDMSYTPSNPNFESSDTNAREHSERGYQAPPLFTQQSFGGMSALTGSGSGQLRENTNEDEVPKGGGVENDIRDDLMRSSESENNSMEGALEDELTLEEMSDGESVVVDPPVQKENISSFQRQLNMYGFSKISGGELSGSFRREGFFRGQKEFDHILRKVTQKSVKRKVTKNKDIGSRKALAKEDGEKEGDSGEKMGRKERKLSA